MGCLEAKELSPPASAQDKDATAVKNGSFMSSHLEHLRHADGAEADGPAVDNPLQVSPQATRGIQHGHATASSVESIDGLLRRDNGSPTSDGEAVSAVAPSRIRRLVSGESFSAGGGRRINVAVHGMTSPANPHDGDMSSHELEGVCRRDSLPLGASAVSSPSATSGAASSLFVFQSSITSSEQSSSWIGSPHAHHHHGPHQPSHRQATQFGSIEGDVIGPLA